MSAFPSLRPIPLPAALWRLQPSTGGQFLALELRDAVAHQASYLIYRPDGRFQCEIRPSETWWMGIEACGTDTLVLHAYEEKGLPVHRGLYAFDLHSGAPRWQLPPYQASGLCAEGLLVQAPGQQPQLLALDSGKPLPPPSNSPEALAAFARQQQAHYAYPTLCLATDPDFAAYQAQIARQTGLTASLQIEKLPIAEGEWVHFYVKKADSQVERYLLQLRGSQASPPLRLDADAKGLLPEPYFQWRGQLIAQGDPQTLWLEQR